MAQSILTNASVASGGRLVSVALGVVTTALVSRLLGPQSYGAYSVLLSVGSVLVLFADGGLYLTLTREIAARPDRERSVFWSIVLLRLLLLLVVMSAGWLLVWQWRTLAGLGVAFGALAVGLSAQSISQLLMGVYQQHRVVWRATVGDVLGRVMHVGAVAVLAAAAVTVERMSVALMLGMLAALALHAWLLPRWQRGGLVRQPWRQWRQWVVVSWPLGVLLLLNAIYFRADVVVLSLFREQAEVGWYALAYRIVESSLFFPAMLGGLLLPRVTRALTGQQRARAVRYVAEGLWLLTVAATAALAGVLLLAPWLVSLVAGAAFAPAAGLLRLLAPALAIMFLGNLFGFVLVALQQQRRLLLLYSGLVLVNVAANFLLIPRWGAPAAAGTTVVTEGIAMLVAGWWVWQRLPFTLAGRLVLRLGGLLLLVLVVGAAVRSAPGVVQAVIFGVLALGGGWLLRLLPRSSLQLLLERGPS